MYCGSCLRDNALAAELKATGHDVTLMPIYTPTLVDEENVSDAHVFFGGISLFSNSAGIRDPAGAPKADATSDQRGQPAFSGAERARKE